MKLDNFFREVRVPGAYIVAGAGSLRAQKKLRRALKRQFGSNLRLYPQELGRPVTIQDVRAVEKLTFLAPLAGKQTVVAIFARDLTLAAQPALLKTLEELPERVCVIIVAGEYNDVLATIKSRCRRLRLNLDFFHKTPENRTSLKNLLSQTLPAKIKAITRLAKRSDLANNIDAWMQERRWARENPRVLEGLFFLKESIAKNINKRLALDYFLFMLDKG